jgi:hypothetical protein
MEMLKEFLGNHILFLEMCGLSTITCLLPLGILKDNVFKNNAQT